MIEKIPMLRLGQIHAGVLVTKEYLKWLFPQLEVLTRCGQLWGYNQIPRAEDYASLLRSHLSHHVHRVHLLENSIWVDIEILDSEPGKDLKKLMAVNQNLGAHLRVLGNPSGAFKIIGIDVFPMTTEQAEEWGAFMQENTSHEL